MRQFAPLSMHSLAATVLTAAWLLSIPAVTLHAQSALPGSSDQTQNISEQKLDAAAAALKQVASVKENYKQQMDAAAPSDRERLAEEVNSALVKAVTDQGLSVQEYNSILIVAQKDPEVREKIAKRILPSAAK
jgi:Domain of unknown function (DUF4168)